jgi:hypothetical protein
MAKLYANILPDSTLKKQHSASVRPEAGRKAPKHYSDTPSFRIGTIRILKNASYRLAFCLKKEHKPLPYPHFPFEILLHIPAESETGHY